MSILAALVFLAICVGYRLSGVHRIFHPEEFDRAATSGPAALNDGADGEAPPVSIDPATAAKRRARTRRSGITRIAGVLVVWFFFGFIPAWDPAPRPPTDATDELAERLRWAGEEYRRERGIVGLTIAAIADGKQAVVGVGRRSAWDARPPDADTLFE
ncbi:MAG TPA: hypothetical protein VNC50_04430, partial [Planctomycetia bacterium]|nr:hypothetical protein [Planctomycetia bacterium]